MAINVSGKYVVWGLLLSTIILAKRKTFVSHGRKFIVFLFLLNGSR